MAWFWALSAWTALSGGCKPDPTPEPLAFGIFEISVRPSFNGTALQTGLYYTLDSLRVRIDTLQILTTGPDFDGGASFFDRPYLYSFTAGTGKTTHGPGVYYVFDVEAKKYSGARLRCGLPDGVSDSARPSDFAEDHPLGARAGMFHGGKYAHLKVVGKVVADGDTAAFRWFLTQSPFEWATPQAFEIRKGREVQWALETEWSQFFSRFSPLNHPEIGDSAQKFVSDFRVATYSYLNEY